MRYLSIEHRGARSAFAMETWTLTGSDPADATLMEEIYARGGSMSDHPKAGEAIYVIAESDAGTTMRMHRIIRDGDMVTLEAGETDFDPAATARSGGLFSKFHVPTSFQTHPAAQAFRTGMATIIKSHIERVTPMPTPKAN